MFKIFPKKERGLVKKNSNKGGISVHSLHFHVVVKKKDIKLANDRNLIKRRIRSAIREVYGTRDNKSHILRKEMIALYYSQSICSFEEIRNFLYYNKILEDKKV